MIFRGSANLHKIVVLNPKGGSGKTTLAFNLAGYLATTGRKVAAGRTASRCGSSGDFGRVDVGVVLAARTTRRADRRSKRDKK